VRGPTYFKWVARLKAVQRSGALASGSNGVFSPLSAMRMSAAMSDATKWSAEACGYMTPAMAKSALMKDMAAETAAAAK
jgi:hypothetical protein